MKDSTQKPTKTRLYKDAPLHKVSIDEMAEKWVEMMIELLQNKDKRRLTNMQNVS